jgi:hypothetical protein
MKAVFTFVTRVPSKATVCHPHSKSVFALFTWTYSIMLLISLKFSELLKIFTVENETGINSRSR